MRGEAMEKDKTVRVDVHPATLLRRIVTESGCNLIVCFYDNRKLWPASDESFCGYGGFITRSRVAHSRRFFGITVRTSQEVVAHAWLGKNDEKLYLDTDPSHEDVTRTLAQRISEASPWSVTVNVSEHHRWRL